MAQFVTVWGVSVVGQKPPGICVPKDGYSNMGALLAECNTLTIISKCMFGSYSPFIKNVFDRSLPYLRPYFATVNKETHHKNRYDNTIALSVHFYGEDITEKEQKTAKNLVTANSINFYCDVSNVYFHTSLQAVREALQ